jgi:hypothetical protein
MAFHTQSFVFPLLMSYAEYGENRRYLTKFS